MNGILFFLLCMEAVKLQTLASWYFFIVGGELPFSLTFALPLLSAALESLLRKTRSRVVVHLLVHTAFISLYFFALRALSIGAIQAGGAHPAAAASGSRIFLPGPNGDSLSYFSTAVWMAIFWIRGVWTAAKRPDHKFCVARFDEGLAMFLVTFVVAAFVGAKNSLPDRLLIPYFLFGIISIGLARGKNSAKRDARGGTPPIKTGFAARTGKTALIPSAATFALAALGLVALTPALFAPAKTAAAALKSVGGTLAYYIGIALRWLFGQKQFSFAAEKESANTGKVAEFKGGDDNSGKLFADIVMWIFIVGAALFVLALLAFLAAQLFRYLSRRVEKDSSGGGFSLPSWLKSFIKRIDSFFEGLRRTLFKRRPRSEAAAAFARLVSIGRLFGLPFKRTDTPREYAGRIGKTFPRAAAGAGEVASLLELEIYGEKAPDPAASPRRDSARPRVKFSSFLSERISRFGIQPRRRG